MNSKRIIATLLSIVILIAATFVCSAANFSDTGLDNELGYSAKELKSMERFDKTFLKNQSKASEVYNKLNHSFGKVGMLKADDYPEYYGGAYINDDGKLVVNFTDDSTTNKQDLKKRVGTDEFTINKCKYSFKMLTKIMDTLNSYKHKNPKDPISTNFNYYALLDAQNIVVVYLDEYNQEQIEAFKKHVLDSPAIEFKQETGKFTDETDVNAGSKITNGALVGSVGYRVRLNGVDGIITAGHFVDLNGYVAKDNIVFATCTARQYSGSVDASFCKITSSYYTPTNTIEGTGTTLSTTISEPGAGTVINKVGGSTGHSSGKIISTNASHTTDGITFTNLTSADYPSSGGDSGAIIYSYISSTNTRYTLGIHKGVKSDGTRVYVKANQINSALGTSRY